MSDGLGCPDVNVSYSQQPAAIGICGYYGSSTEQKSSFQHADVLVMLKVLLEDLGLVGVFSDFPLVVSAFANCILDKNYSYELTRLQ